LAFDFRAHPIKHHAAARGGVFKIAAGKPDRYKGFVPDEGFGLNTNPCGRSWSCATAAMASGQLAYMLTDVPLSSESRPVPS
jgi:hypothetical protein